jgi:hypothetical protein
VVKIARSPERNWLLAAQYSTLRRHREQLDGVLRDAIPAPLFGGEIEGRYVLVQNGMPGHIVRRGLGRRRWPWQRRAFGRTLGEVRDWLLEFQRQTYSGTISLTEEFIRSQYLQAIETFRAAYTLDVVESEYLDALQNSCQVMAGMEIPQTAHHGDFYVENLLFHKDGLGVFDWSASKDVDLPLWDAFLFVSTLHIREREQDGPKPPQIMLLRHPLRPMLIDFLRDVARRWRISEHLLPVFFGLFLVRMSTRTALEFGDNAGRNHLWRKAFGHYVRRQWCWEVA